VKDKRKGPIGRATGIAEGVAAAVRRMQREREPRVLVYDQTGYARLVQPEARGHERILDIADRMVQLATGAEEVGGGPRGGGAAGAGGGSRGGGSEEAA